MKAVVSTLSHSTRLSCTNAEVSCTRLFDLNEEAIRFSSLDFGESLKKATGRTTLIISPSQSWN